MTYEEFPFCCDFSKGVIVMHWPACPPNCPSGPVQTHHLRNQTNVSGYQLRYNLTALLIGSSFLEFQIFRLLVWAKVGYNISEIRLMYRDISFVTTQQLFQLVLFFQMSIFLECYIVILYPVWTRYLRNQTYVLGYQFCGVLDTGLIHLMYSVHLMQCKA